MRTVLKFLFPAVVLVSASGCSTTFDPQFGDSVKNNIGTQAIDYMPGYGTNTATLDGQKAEKLLDEYREEKPEVTTETLIRDIGD